MCDVVIIYLILYFSSELLLNAKYLKKEATLEKCRIL